MQPAVSATPSPEETWDPNAPIMAKTTPAYAYSFKRGAGDGESGRGQDEGCPEDWHVTGE